MLNITEEEYHEFEENGIGLCTFCGSERECVEPDAEKYECDVCHKKAVYGVPQLLIMGLLTFEDGE